MFGRILCWVGWHDWAYMQPGYGHEKRRHTARLMVQYGYDYRCLRCGEQP